MFYVYKGIYNPIEDNPTYQWLCHWFYSSFWFNPSFVSDLRSTSTITNVFSFKGKDISVDILIAEWKMIYS